jgi:hypothetical protein
MKTDKQITNAHTRAASLAFEAAKASQGELFAATLTQMTGERGHAMNAAGFAASALAHLENGNYESFITCMSLAADFTKDARDNFYARTLK